MDQFEVNGRQNLRLVGKRQDRLPVDLTTDEFRERMQELGRTHDQMKQHESHEKEVKTRLKAEGEELAARADRLASVARSGQEDRDCTVTTYADIHAKEFVETIEQTVTGRDGTRMVTQKIHRVKAMNADELNQYRQEILDLSDQSAQGSVRDVTPKSLPPAAEEINPDAINSDIELQAALKKLGYDVPLAVVADWSDELVRQVREYIVSTIKNIKEPNSTEQVAMPEFLSQYLRRPEAGPQDG